MATSEFWQRVSAFKATSTDREASLARERIHSSRRSIKLWVVLDAITILVSAALATILEFHYGPLTDARRLYRGTLLRGRSMGILFALLVGFSVVLILQSKRLHLYSPRRITSILSEQLLSLQACFISGLLLTGTLYLLHADDIPRGIVLMTVGLVTCALGLRRLVYRIFLYRRFDRGLDTRNALIVGTGPQAGALRRHLDSMRLLGYKFKGFIDTQVSCSSRAVDAGEIVGNMENLFQNARRQFVDEIFLTAPCDHETLQIVLGQARVHGIDLRLVPDLYNGQAWERPIEYVGQFPTIPLHYGNVPELGLFFKRAFDIVFSSLLLIVAAPLLAAIAVSIKLDSPGPVLYKSDRIGKKGRVFPCFKFRTMVADADQRRAEILHMNERDGVLFKVSNDPRITRLGRFLRRYSLDELPQFFNVLRGDMSVVGPRPPLAGEVKNYKLNHLRRLDVIPGITGLWQVQGRKDPSFDSYVSLDVTYIDNWSLWLDFKLILRTIGVVLSGTGI